MTVQDYLDDFTLLANYRGTNMTDAYFIALFNKGLKDFAYDLIDTDTGDSLISVRKSIENKVKRDDIIKMYYIDLNDFYPNPALPSKCIKVE